MLISFGCLFVCVRRVVTGVEVNDCMMITDDDMLFFSIGEAFIPPKFTRRDSNQGPPPLPPPPSSPPPPPLPPPPLTSTKHIHRPLLMIVDIIYISFRDERSWGA